MERHREDFCKEMTVSSCKMKISGDNSVYCNDSTQPTLIDSFLSSFCSVHITIRVLEVVKHIPELTMGCVGFGGPGT